MQRSVSSDTLLEVNNLVKHFPIKGGVLRRTVAVVKAVDGVSFTLKRGETLGLVGESGCGKTTTGRTILRLERATDGEVIFDGKDVLAASGSQLKALRRDMQIVFQDPYASLDPRMTIGESVAEGLTIHGIGSKAERIERVREVLTKVGMHPSHMERFPHEFSGGQRQRIGIARALVMNPKLIVCDEPVSALDVSIQAQILNLLQDLQQQFRLTYLFVAHDLSVVEHISDRIAVMYVARSSRARRHPGSTPCRAIRTPRRCSLPCPNLIPVAARRRLFWRARWPTRPIRRRGAIFIRAVATASNDAPLSRPNCAKLRLIILSAAIAPKNWTCKAFFH